jgi:ATP-dependent DNA helicase RecG
VDAAAWLESPVTAVEGVSGRAAGALKRAFEIRTVRDLLTHYPSQEHGKYRDIGAHLPLSDAPLGEPVTLVGTIAAWKVIRPRGRRMTVAKAVLVDDGGGKVEVPFFNQEWRAKQLPEGTRVAVSGVLERFRGDLQLKGGKLVTLDEGGGGIDPDARIQPTYPATERVPSPRIARYVRAALAELPAVGDFLPDLLLARHALVDLDTALRRIHQPRELAEVKPARERLVYDELLCLQVGLQQRRHRLESEEAGIPQAPRAEGLAQRFLDRLPFRPTAAQYRAFAELGADLGRSKPMHRLLQGDVGAGKTLVAAWAMLTALDHGRQAVLMAPTEVLAEQHLRTFTQLLAPLGVNVLDGPRVELLTGSTKASRLRGLLAEIMVGDVQLLIGTHALLEQRVAFHDLGVVVIDEQHRFGVEHRTRLKDKGRNGRTPDVLVMTATPIPRSLALTLYGDLEVTTLDELPPGRQEIVTQVIERDSPRRERLYAFVRERVHAGERAYVVCPLIEASDALEDVAAAVDVHRHLSHEVFADLGVGIVHGRLPSGERDHVMEAFRDGGIQVLVSTTVIEVGVDVAEATVMVIEDADRFGISQLHQLRGRVGRGSAKSYCVLFAGEVSGNARLEALAATTDGFRLAETDLELRGEGSLFDTRQSGLPDLKLARLIRDQRWVQHSRDDARQLVDTDPELIWHPGLRGEVARRYGDERLAAMETG